MNRDNTHSASSLGEGREGVKHNLSQITFIIPFFYDSPERLENLECIVHWLRVNFETNIIVVDNTTFGNNPYFGLDGNCAIYNLGNFTPIFNRTKTINYGIKAAKTPFVAIYDTDVIFDIEHFVSAYLKLTHQYSSYSMVYPYNGKFVDIDRSFITDGIINARESFAENSLGGAVFLNKAHYLKAGLENENIISWGPEDAERYARMQNLGYLIYRTPGTCYHIQHPIGINSGTKNPHYEANVAEYQKVKAMGMYELVMYVKTWPWAK